MGGPRRRWSSRPPRGSAVADPAVLAFLERGDPGGRPQVHVQQGRRIVAWSSTRVHMKRDGWDLLTPDSLVVIWIRPTGESPWAMALTPSELERAFGEVKESRSWDEVREYHFPQPPPAAEAFRVRLGSPPRPAPQATPASPPSEAGPSHRRRRPVEVVAAEVLAALRQHGSLSEAELTRLAGGASGYRQLRRHLERRITVEQTPQGAIWRMKP